MTLDNFDNFNPSSKLYIGNNTIELKRHIKVIKINL